MVEEHLFLFRLWGQTLRNRDRFLSFSGEMTRVGGEGGVGSVYPHGWDDYTVCIGENDEVILETDWGIGSILGVWFSGGFQILIVTLFICPFPVSKSRVVICQRLYSMTKEINTSRGILLPSHEILRSPKDLKWRVCYKLDHSPLILILIRHLCRNDHLPSVSFGSLLYWNSRVYIDLPN